MIITLKLACAKHPGNDISLNCEQCKDILEQVDQFNGFVEQGAEHGYAVEVTINGETLVP